MPLVILSYFIYIKNWLQAVISNFTTNIYNLRPNSLLFTLMHISKIKWFKNSSQFYGMSSKPKYQVLSKGYGWVLYIYIIRRYHYFYTICWHTIEWATRQSPLPMDIKIIIWLTLLLKSIYHSYLKKPCDVSSSRIWLFILKWYEQIQQLCHQSPESLPNVV